MNFCSSLGYPGKNGYFQGGWAGGNAAKDLAKNSELMWTQSVCSSVIAASLASKFLKEGGVLQLTGAKAALDATPGMIGYGNTSSK